MEVRQICAGVCRNARCLAFISHQGSELVASVVSGKSLLLMRDDLSVLQQLELGDEAQCLAWSRQGKLAVLSRTRVSVYRLASAHSDERSGTAVKLWQLELFAVLDTTPPSACCWMWAKERLYVGLHTGDVVLFDLSTEVRRDGSVRGVPERLSTFSTAASPRLMQVSPDDAFLAINGENDRLIKVFYRDGKRFSYLRHPRAVTNFSWRASPVIDSNVANGAGVGGGVSASSATNFLLTSCRDDVHRLWMQASSRDGHHYKVGDDDRAEDDVDEAHLYEEERALRNEGTFFWFVVGNVVDAPPSTTVAWLRCKDVVVPTRSAQSARELKKSSRSESRVKFAAISEDWLVGVSSAGVILIWGLQNVASAKNRRSPSVFIWTKLPALPKEEGFPLTITAKGESLLLDKQKTLIGFNMHIMSRSGSVTAWHCGLRSGVTSMSRSCFGAMWGHSSAVRQVGVDKRASLLFSLDCAGVCIVSQARSTQMTEPPAILIEVFRTEDVASACWLLSSPEVGDRDATETAPAATLVVCSSSTPGKLTFWSFQAVSGVGSMSALAAADNSSSSSSSSPSSVVSSFSRYEGFPVGSVTVGSAACQASLVSLCRSADDGDSFSLLGLSAAGEATFFVFSGLAKGPVTLKSSVVAPQGGKRVASVASVAPLAFEKLDFHAVLGSTDGEVSFWSKEGSRLGGFMANTDGKAIEMIRVAYCGRFATRFAGSSDVQIWEAESNAPQIVLECTVRTETADGDDGSTRSSFDWLNLADGNHMLALGYGKRVRLLLETGSKDLQSYAVGWTDVATSAQNLSAACTSLGFLGDGTLVAGTARNELFVWTKWLGSRTLSASSSVVSADEDQSTVFRKAHTMAAALPPYHPKMLAEYMMRGQFPLIKKILRATLDFMGKSGDAAAAVPSLSLEEIFTSSSGPSVFRGTKANKPSMGGSISQQQTSGVDYLFKEKKLSDVRSAFDSDAGDDGVAPIAGPAASTDDFEPQDARHFSEMLSRVALPGISRKSQLHLLAIVDTFRQILEVGQGLDDSGSRFFISLKVYQFLRKTNPSAKFAVSNWAWALQSQAHETLLNHIGSALSWDDVRVFGIPLWLKNPEKLKLIAENVAKAQFMARKDPFDCMLMYVALKRVNVLSKMFRVAKKDKVAEFLMSDFKTDRAQTAAEKNAYSLMKQQQYGQAASFFLLSGGLRDCLKIILKHEKDYMLALLVARLVEPSGSSEHFHWVLTDHIIPLAQETNDHWLLSIARWLLGDFVGSLNALLLWDVAAKDVSAVRSKNDRPVPYSRGAPSSDFNPVVTYYIDHLKTSTELVKYTQTDDVADAKLRRKTVFANFNSGCIYQALDQLVTITREAAGSSATKSSAADGVGKKDLGRPTGDSNNSGNDNNNNSNNNNNNAGSVAGADSGSVSTKMSSLFPLKKKPAPAAPVDSGVMSIFAFDDGFGDMPTPAWAMPKATEATSAAASSSLGNANGSNSAEDGAVVDDVRIYETDHVMKLKVAHVYLVSLSRDFWKEMRSQSGNDSAGKFMESCRSRFRSALEMLASKLELPLASLQSFFKQYLRAFELVLLHYVMLEPADVPLFLDSRVRSLFSVVVSWFEVETQLPVAQLSALNHVSFELGLCVEHAAKTSTELQPLRSSLLADATLVTLVGTFIPAWSMQQYDKLAVLVLGDKVAADFLPDDSLQSGKPMQSAYDGSGDQSALAQLDSGDESSASSSPHSDASSRFVFMLMRSLIFEAFVRRVFFFLLTNDRGSLHFGAMAERVLAYCGESPERALQLRMVEVLLRFREDLTTSLRAFFYSSSFLLPTGNRAQLNSSTSSSSSETDSFDSLWLQIIRSSPVYQNEGAGFQALCDTLCTTGSVMTDVLKNASLSLSSVSSSSSSSAGGSAPLSPSASSGGLLQQQQQQLESRANGNHVTFGPAEVLIHENDILHHFCIGHGESTSVVLCTARGQSEMALETLVNLPSSLRKPAQQLSSQPSLPLRSSLDRSKMTSSSSSKLPSAAVAPGSPSPNSPSGASLQSSPPQNSASSPSVGGAGQMGPLIPLSSFLNKQEMASCVAAHPLLPFYVGAGIDGSVSLHQFGFPELLTPYRKPSPPRVHSIRFSATGSRFGCVDDTGTLALWQFDSNLDSQKPFFNITSHKKRANDLCFIDAGNVVATAGLSRKSDTASNLCVWDTLIAPARSCVMTFPGHDKGATRVIYVQSRNMMISGGKKGEILAWDLRHPRQALHRLDAHELNVRSLSLDDREQLLASGSSDGFVKVWSLPDFSVVFQEELHKQHSVMKSASKFLTSAISTLGVLHAGFWKDSLFTCGADGRFLALQMKRN